MIFEIPTEDQIKAAADELGIDLGANGAADYHALAFPFGAAFSTLDDFRESLPSLKYGRGPVHRPSAAENPFNAWYVRATVKGAPTGKLTGRTIVLKDNIMLAGVPMMNGTTLLEGYTPEVDATVVTRILDAGGEIVGKAHCEAFCLSGGSHTNATGAVHNPRRHGYSAGGSSSGCAALVAAGEVDMAIGGDQGGSVRMPASYCGIYGMKATYGLVPYTGILPIETTIDHAGPMTRSVYDNALLLEVIAGTDGFDPRQYSPQVRPYTHFLHGGIAGLRIGIVNEGFGQPLSEPAVDEAVRSAAKEMERLGAIVEEISIPFHTLGGAAATVVAIDGTLQTLRHGDGFGFGREDLYPTSLIDFARGWDKRANELPAIVKFALIIGTAMRRSYGVHYYARARHVIRALRAAYDQALSKFDLLLLPTTPMKATPLPGSDASTAELILRAVENTSNTQQFNNTHHPAMSLPCKLIDGLPVGLMLVGKHWDEATIYRAAFAFERNIDWENA